jgi:tetratricopeptide (TPR) repeat protein
LALLAARPLDRLRETRGRPESIAPLLRLLDLVDLGPPGALDAPIRAAAEAADTDPLVAAAARVFLADRAESEGAATTRSSREGPGDAAEPRRGLGLLTHLWVVGPFGEGRSGYGVAFPPELQSLRGAPDPAQVMPGKERPVAWRRAENAEVRGALQLEALLRPSTQGTAYVLAWVRVERAGLAALRLGTPGPVKVWCNGALVHAADRRRPARFDQDAIGVSLTAGWNQILIKTVVGEASWRVFARLTEPGGAPLEFRSAFAPEEDPGAGSPSGARASLSALASAARPMLGPPARTLSPARPVRSLERELRARVRAAGRAPEARAEAWLDLGQYLQVTHPGDADQKEAAHAYAESWAARPSFEAMLGAARVARDEDESRRMLERALSLAESLPPTPMGGTRALDLARVLAGLGDIARDQRREAVALDRWRAALAAAPSWWPAAVALAAEERNAGLPATALARVAALPAAFQDIPTVIRERLQALLALDRRVEAEAEARRLLAHAHTDVDLLRELAGFARDRGRTQDSVELLGAAARLRPDVPSFALDWARAQEGAGRGAGEADGAVEILTRATRQLPDEPTLAAELGKLLERLGRPVEGARWLEVALTLRPQDAELRRYVDAAVARQRHPSAPSGPAQEARDDLPRRFAVSAPTLLAEELGPGRGQVSAARSSRPASGEPDGAVVLLDRHVVRVHDNGLSETFAQRLVQVRTDAGAEENKEFSVRYTPGSEEVEILEARIYRPRPPSVGAAAPGGDSSGDAGWDVIQVSERDDQDLSEPWYGLYYDYRAEIVRFEGLRAGDVIEIAYMLSDVSQENQMAGYFGDLQFLAEGVPKRRWDYVLLGPPGRTFHIAAPVVPGLVRSDAIENGERVLRFSARDLPRVELEPAMPGLAEISPFLHISTYGRAADVGAWYWRLIAEQLKPDDTIRAAAEAEVPTRLRRRMSDLDKVRAIHAFVVGQTRYVGLEFGIHGFKPYKVSQVLSRKFGDCKDKAALMVALLGEVGIDADMVLLRTRRGGLLAADPPSLAGFDHAIAYIPKLDLYLDGTAEFSGVDELPSQDQGVPVLRIGPRGAVWATTPLLPSSRNRASRRWSVVLTSDGGADVREELTVAGQAASEWRQHYQTVGEQGERYGKVWSGRHPGAHLLWVKMPGLMDRNRPVTVLARATLPRLGELLPGGGMALGLGVRDGDLVRNYARLSARRSDLLLAYPWQHEERVSYRLPPGFRIERLPGARELSTRFGRFALSIEPSGPSTLVVSSRLDVARARIAPGDYPDFRRFLGDVDAIMRERVILAPPVVARSQGKGAVAPRGAPTGVVSGAGVGPAALPGPSADRLGIAVRPVTVGHAP